MAWTGLPTSRKIGIKIFITRILQYFPFLQIYLLAVPPSKRVLCVFRQVPPSDISLIFLLFPSTRFRGINVPLIVTQ